MKDKFFLDTNIIVYSFDKDNTKKRVLADNLISEALENSTGIISSQVVQEFLNVAIRKFQTPLTFSDCRRYLNVVLDPLCAVFSAIDLYRHALDVMERWQYSFYDSMIISAAIQGGCTILYSEDLQHRQKINNLTIIDPFREE